MTDRRRLGRRRPVQHPTSTPRPIAGATDASTVAKTLFTLSKNGRQKTRDTVSCPLSPKIDSTHPPAPLADPAPDVVEPIGVRTDDLLNANQALSRLSYGPVPENGTYGSDHGF